jgi:hypothetical protein
MSVTSVVAESTRRQAEAYLVAEAARASLANALDALRHAEDRRLRPSDPLTVVVDGKAVTSHHSGPDRSDWTYIVSRVVE